MEVWSIQWNKTGFLLSDGGVNIIVRMHHVDGYKTQREKARRELYKNATSYSEQILEVPPHETTGLGHLPPILKTIQVRRTRHVGDC